MLTLTVAYAILSVITWSAFAYKVRDLFRDWRNRELQLLCLAIATFAAPFVLASPHFYIAIDEVLGVANIASLIIYLCVATCLTSFVALLVSWSSAADKVRLLHRVLVAYSLVTVIVMIVFFFMGNVAGPEHPVDFDVHFEAVPYISVFLLSYQLLFSVSMGMLVVLCRRYARAVEKTWLRRGLRVVVWGAAFGLGYSVPKVLNMIWDLFGASPLHYVSSIIAPLFASVAAALFAVGFTMPAWGEGVDRTRRHTATFRAYRRLYPLWSDLATLYPTLVLFPPVERTTRWSHRNARKLAGRLVVEVSEGRLALRAHDDPEVGQINRLQYLDLLLNRQSKEIRDTQLQLRTFFTEEIADSARRYAQRRGLDGLRAEAVIEAQQLAAAMQQVRQNQGTTGSQVGDLYGPAGADEAGEIAWMVLVASEYGKVKAAA